MMLKASAPIQRTKAIMHATSTNQLKTGTDIKGVGSMSFFCFRTFPVAFLLDILSSSMWLLVTSDAWVPQERSRSRVDRLCVGLVA